MRCHVVFHPVRIMQNSVIPVYHTMHYTSLMNDSKII